MKPFKETSRPFKVARRVSFLILFPLFLLFGIAAYFFFIPMFLFGAAFNWITGGELFDSGKAAGILIDLSEDKISPWMSKLADVEL